MKPAPFACMAHSDAASGDCFWGERREGGVGLSDRPRQLSSIRVGCATAVKRQAQTCRHWGDASWAIGCQHALYAADSAAFNLLRNVIDACCRRDVAEEKSKLYGGVHTLCLRLPQAQSLRPSVLPVYSDTW